MTSIDELVDTEYGAIWRLVYLETRDPETANDLTQEAFVRLLAWTDRHPTRPFHRGLLIRIAVNLCHDYWRKHRTSVVDEAVQASAEGTRIDVEDLWDLEAALRRLDEKAREIIILHYFMESSLAEIAQALGIRPGTVKTRLFRTRTKLARILEGFPGA